MRVFLAGCSGVFGVKGHGDCVTVWYYDNYTDIDRLVTALNEKGYPAVKMAFRPDFKPQIYLHK